VAGRSSGGDRAVGVARSQGAGAGFLAETSPEQQVVVVVEAALGQDVAPPVFIDVDSSTAVVRRNSLSSTSWIRCPCGLGQIPRRVP
jgi:hypothetical protein